MPSLVTIVSRCTVIPDQKSSLPNLKLSVSDLPMLSCQYIQKGVLLTRPPLPIDLLVLHLKRSLAHTLTLFPPLAGRLVTDSHGFVYISCNDAGVEFVHANATRISIRDALINNSPNNNHRHYVPYTVKEFFAFDGAISYDGHFKPVAAVQFTELADGVFVSCTVNHAITDGTSFWNFFNTFAEVCNKGLIISSMNDNNNCINYKLITKQPDFRRNFSNDTQAVLRFPNGSPKVTFDINAPLRERIFHFSREAILSLKSKANSTTLLKTRLTDGAFNEILGKQSNDWKLGEKQHNVVNGKITSVLENWLKITGTAETQQDRKTTAEISSFQSLCAQLWRSVTRARKLMPSKQTTFRMAVNCRHRLEPRIDPYYFGNAIQSIPTSVSVGELLSRDLHWSAEQLHRNVVAHDGATVRRGVEEWEKNPRCFPLGNFDGASITMGSSPRFPMYENDFGWGRPVAVRSGKANKFDGKISAFPGREGGGTVDLEVCLAPETMAGLESDQEFMQYVSIVG